MDNYLSVIETNYFYKSDYSCDDHFEITSFLVEIQTEHQIDIDKCLKQNNTTTDVMIFITFLNIKK